jgi:Protein of unknown function (DUF3489)
MPKLAKKSANKRSPKAKPPRATTIEPSHPAVVHSAIGKAGDTPSKQARVIAMLRSPTGTTVAAMMQATGWQQHSVRGFLAGVVRKKLKLPLASTKVNGNRIYRISDQAPPKARRSQTKRRAA